MDKAWLKKKNDLNLKLHYLVQVLIALDGIKMLKKIGGLLEAMRKTVVCRAQICGSASVTCVSRASACYSALHLSGGNIVPPSSNCRR